MQVQVDIETRAILAAGEFPDGSPDPERIAVYEIDDAEAAKLYEPGVSTLDADDTTITTTAPDADAPDPYADPERDAKLALVAERAADDPAFAALAALALGVSFGERG